MHKFKELLITENTTIRSAMKRIQSTSRRALFIVDRDLRLLGAINDGDIRRWILAKKNINCTVRDAYNRKPISVKGDSSPEEIKKLMVKHWIETIPVLDDKGCVYDIVFISDLFGRKQLPKPKENRIAVAIMAGGIGARLDPFTRILPKPLVPIGEKPVIEIIIEQFRKFGFSRFYLVLNYKAGMVKTYFDNTKLAHYIHYINEEKLNGTAGGLRLLPEAIGEHIFVSNCDTFIKADYKDMYDFHLNNSNDITVVGSMQHFRIPYGVLELSEQGNLSRLIEKPEFDHLVNTGMYIVRKSMLKLIPRGEVFHFTHLIKKALSVGGKVKVFPISEKAWLDVGQWSEYRKNLKHFGI